MTGEQKTHFGTQKVSMSQKTQLVTDVFKRVAGSYDLMNDLMSLGIHRLWKQELIHLLRPRSYVRMLDVAGGTGDIALRFLQASQKVHAEDVHVTVCDRNPSMVHEGRNKALDTGIIQNLDWMVGDATALPFKDNSFDIYTIAFGLRNVTEPQKALDEAFRVLKPGGMFYCLEFSKVSQPILQKLYKFHSFSIIPRIGQLIAQDKAAYDYLVQSIEQFPAPEILLQMLGKSGLQHTSFQTLSFGVVAIHIGMK